MTKPTHFSEKVFNQVKSIPQIYDCTCCGSHNTKKTKVIMANFVIERMLDRVQLDDWETEAIQCQDCFYIATVFRFTDEQMQRYYEDYMQIGNKAGRQYGGYVFHRLRNEGKEWFKLAQAYQMPEYFQIRKEAVIRSITDYVNVADITSVLDYGGDLGQYIPDEFINCRRYVAEIEDREFVDGVTAVQSPVDCDPVDLVMCCHTLEHVSYPSDLVKDMLQYLRPNGLLYIEVPNEIEYVKKNSQGNAIMQMHEHINIFHSESLKALLRRHGIQPLNVFDLRYDTVYEAFSPAFAVVGIKT